MAERTKLKTVTNYGGQLRDHDEVLKEVYEFNQQTQGYADVPEGLKMKTRRVQEKVAENAEGFKKAKPLSKDQIVADDNITKANSKDLKNRRIK